MTFRLSLQKRFTIWVAALVIFLVLVKLLERVTKKKEETPAAPTTRECPACLEQVAIQATRCKYCTSQL